MKPSIGQQLRRHFSTSVHHSGIDQVSVRHAIQQRISEGGLPALASEGAVGVEQQPSALPREDRGRSDWSFVGALSGSPVGVAVRPSL